MTQQIIHASPTVNITGCKQCKLYGSSDIFQVCKHPTSQYLAGTGVPEPEYHTIQHMRGSFDRCGPEKRYFKC